jgi:hypothetical protein
LIRYMRNAIAHFNVRFRASGDGKLTGLTLWNRRGGNDGPKTWEALFTAEELRGLTIRFIDILTTPTDAGPARRRGGAGC